MRSESIKEILRNTSKDSIKVQKFELDSFYHFFLFIVKPYTFNPFKNELKRKISTLTNRVKKKKVFMLRLLETQQRARREKVLNLPYSALFII